MTGRKIVKIKLPRRTKDEREQDKSDMILAESALEMGIDQWVEFVTRMDEESRRTWQETVQRVTAKARELQRKGKSPSTIIKFKKEKSE
jgi:hypothetical protein